MKNENDGGNIKMVDSLFLGACIGISLAVIGGGFFIANVKIYEGITLILNKSPFILKIIIIIILIFIGGILFIGLSSILTHILSSIF
ncbi:hypothetical protein [Clostridium perfringens]|uniref:hypothetical protein n=1 Tax=Clostridium perfringens TaxID=1502 RepID=UPI0024BC4CC3|nr:hypothetical protein [Clostridium perfringens]